MNVNAKVVRNVKFLDQSDPISVTSISCNNYLAMHVGGAPGGFIGEGFLQMTMKIGSAYETFNLGPDEVLALACWFANHIKIGKNEIV
jgi:hypothetical protein